MTFALRMHTKSRNEQRYFCVTRMCKNSSEGHTVLSCPLAQKLDTTAPQNDSTERCKKKSQVAFLEHSQSRVLVAHKGSVFYVAKTD